MQSEQALELVQFERVFVPLFDSRNSLLVHYSDYFEQIEIALVFAGM